MVTFCCGMQSAIWLVCVNLTHFTYSELQKKLDVDLIPQTAISGTVWVHPGDDPPPFRVTFFIQSRIPNLVANKIHFVIAVCAKRGWDSGHIHVLLHELWKYSCTMG